VLAKQGKQGGNLVTELLIMPVHPVNAAEHNGVAIGKVRAFGLMRNVEMRKQVAFGGFANAALTAANLAEPNAPSRYRRTWWHSISYILLCMLDLLIVVGLVHR
jgi:hypothetical protein